MKTECNNCGKVSSKHIVMMHKGTSYAFCNEKCEEEYSKMLLEVYKVTNPIYAGIILPYILFRDWIKSRFKKK